MQNADFVGGKLLLLLDNAYTMKHFLQPCTVICCRSCQDPDMAQSAQLHFIAPCQSGSQCGITSHGAVLHQMFRSLVSKWYVLPETKIRHFLHWQ